MRNDEHQTPTADDSKGAPRDPWVGPDLPSLSAVLIGSVLFLTGGMLLFTVIGASRSASCCSPRVSA
ncbi:MAG: hypothetical protein ACRDHU_14525 [Actinomycetota bacterium]